MKPAYAALLGLLASAATAADSDPWLSKNFPSTSEVHAAMPVPEAHYFEVPASKLAVAEYLLAEQPVIAQEPSQARYFGRPGFTCPASTVLFLLRAVYTNGGTGAYQILVLPAGSVWVSHSSLGRPTGTHRSALLACLEKKPMRVFVSSGGAM